MPYLAKILLYPIKSLDGVEVQKATVLPSGALTCDGVPPAIGDGLRPTVGDREFAIFDAQGKFVNGKRHPKIHLLRSEFSLESRTITLQIPDSDSKQVFHLDAERPALEATLSDYFGFAVTLVQNSLTGFPDDTNSPGPTVISTATLAAAASWYPGLSADELRRRMRANIEIGDVPAFWEDRLFTEDGDTVSFKIGNVRFFGVNPCQRCIVPTRDSYLGTAYPNFQKIFANQRQATLPEWVTSSRFKTFYSLSVNTRLPASEAGKTLEIGNQIEIIP